MFSADCDFLSVKIYAVPFQPEYLTSSHSVIGGYMYNQFEPVTLDWLDAIKPTVSDTTYESYTHVIRKTTEYFDEKYPNLMLNEITALQIQQFYNDKYNSGLTANTIKHYHANIHKALKYAVKMDWLPNNPSEKTELPKLKKFQANFYNAEELAELFKAVCEKLCERKRRTLCR